MGTKEAIKAQIDILHMFFDDKYPPSIQKDVEFKIKELEYQLSRAESIDTKIDELIAKSQEIISEQAKQIAYMKESKSALRKRMHGLHDIYIDIIKRSADERYKKSCDNIDELLSQSFEGWTSEAKRGYITAMSTVSNIILKIAAYGKE